MFDKIFEDGIGGFLTTLKDSAENQTAIDLDLAKKAQEESQTVTTLAAEYNKSAQATLEELRVVQAKGEDARRKAESSNIFDRIELMGDQMLDPRNYTAEGRSRRTAEMSQQLAMEGQIVNVGMAASAARVAEAEASHKVASITNLSAVNILKSQVEAMGLAAQGLQASETLRQNSLMQIDLPTLAKASIGPPNADGRIEIGGMSFTPLELRERANELEKREKLSLMSPQASDPQFAMKMNLFHEMQLSTFSMAELDQLKSNNYQMPDGTVVTPGVFDAEYNRKNQMMATDMQRRLSETTIQDLLPARQQENQALLDRTASLYEPGTPMGTARKQLEAAMMTAAELSKTPDGQTIPAKLQQLEFLDKAQDRYLKEVDKEAMRKSNGNKAVAGIIQRQMLGQPVEFEEVANVYREQYTNRKVFANLLPSKITDQIRREADKNIAVIQQQQAQNQFDINATKLSDKEVREQAFNMAFDSVRAGQGAQTVDQIKKHVMTRQDNPAIKAGIPPAALESLQLKADQLAKDDIQKQFKLSDEQFRYLMAGDSKSANVSAEQAGIIAKQYNLLGISHMYSQLDKEKPGLGYDTQNWIRKITPQITENAIANLDPVMQSVAADSIRYETQSYVDDFNNADAAALDLTRQELTAMSTGVQRPENSWILMLNMNQNLSGYQKASLYYDVVMPTIQEARSLNMNDEQTSDAVFKALDSFKSEDKVLMSSIKMMQRSLPDIVDSFQSNWKTMMVMGQSSMVRAQAVGRDAESANQQLKQVVPWLR